MIFSITTNVNVVYSSLLKSWWGSKPICAKKIEINSHVWTFWRDKFCCHHQRCIFRSFCFILPGLHYWWWQLNLCCRNVLKLSLILATGHFDNINSAFIISTVYCVFTLLMMTAESKYEKAEQKFVKKFIKIMIFLCLNFVLTYA